MKQAMLSKFLTSAAQPKVESSSDHLVVVNDSKSQVSARGTGAKSKGVAKTSRIPQK